MSLTLILFSVVSDNALCVVTLEKFVIVLTIYPPSWPGLFYLNKLLRTCFGGAYGFSELGSTVFGGFAKWILNLES